MYANTAYGEDAETTYNDFVLYSEGGALCALYGAKVVFNSGKIELNSASTSDRYIFYTEGAGSEFVINGGEFSFRIDGLVSGSEDDFDAVYGGTAVNATETGTYELTVTITSKNNNNNYTFKYVAARFTIS
jgi:hypothetical protein